MLAQTIIPQSVKLIWMASSMSVSPRIGPDIFFFIENREVAGNASRNLRHLLCTAEGWPQQSVRNHLDLPNVTPLRRPFAAIRALIARTPSLVRRPSKHGSLASAPRL